MRNWVRLSWVRSSGMGRSEHIFLVCGERNQNRGLSFSCSLWHFFPLGGRKWQAGWKDLEAKGSKDCLYCNFWTLEGHPPHNGVALYPEHSQPLVPYNTPENDLCWSLASVSPLTNGELKLRQGPQPSPCHTGTLLHQSKDANNSDFRDWRVRDAVVGG